MPVSRAWLRTSQAAARLHVAASTVTRWASEGRLTHRRTLGGHRRFDPALIDALAGRHPLHVLFERAGEGLVKVVEVEQQPLFG
jgi:excisionase family DNA binding protein